MNSGLSTTTSIVLGTVVTIALIGAGIYSQSKANAKTSTKSSKSAADTKKRQAKPSSNSTTTAIRDDGEDKDILKGYKKTSDGKTTSYFHREVSDTDLRLLGDCAPKRIDTSSPAPLSPSPTSGSVWNSAGTHEEKNFSPWAEKHLRELLSCTSFPLPSHVSSGVVRNSDIYLINSLLDYGISCC